jgi:hypothetical protein
VRAAEDDRVRLASFSGRVLAHGLRRLGRERVVALDQRHQPRHSDRTELGARVEGAHELA